MVIFFSLKMSSYISTFWLKFDIFLTKLLLVKAKFLQKYNINLKLIYDNFFQKI